MRTRENIEEISEGIPDDNLFQHLALEVLLDIRELLANPGVQNDFGKAKNLLSQEKPLEGSK